MTTNQKGIFIHKHYYKDSSVILLFYSESEGIQKYVYKGGRKKMNLIPFEFYEITGFKRVDSDLGIVRTLSLLSPHLETVNSTPKLMISFFICDVVRQTTREATQGSEGYGLLESVANELNSSTKNHLIPLKFLSLWVEFLGLLPQTCADARGLDTNNGCFTPKNTEFAYWSEGALEWNQYILGESPKVPEKTKLAVDLILKYIKYHFTSFNVDKTAEIIRQTLYI